LSAIPTLADLPVGAIAAVVSVEAPEAVAQRLADLGFLPGTAVRTLRRAPLGDPRVYEVRGMRLCLRQREARTIRVRALMAEPEASPPSATAGAERGAR
jgi:ferrous iron transport protein A